MTYLQSKPITAFQQERPVQTQAQAQAWEQAPTDQSERLLDSNRLVEALQRAQGGARAVHLTLNALNR